MKTNMHYGASPAMFKVAQELRSRPTEDEKILWEYLKKNYNQYRFRRQHPTSRYVVDFYSHKLKMVIEVDGDIHLNTQNQKDDLEREAQLKSLSLFILRFTNDEIFHDLEMVQLQINNTIFELVRKSAL